MEHGKLVERVLSGPLEWRLGDSGSYKDAVATFVSWKLPPPRKDKAIGPRLCELDLCLSDKIPDILILRKKIFI